MTRPEIQYRVIQMNADWPESELESCMNREAKRGWRLVNVAGTGACTLTLFLDRPVDSGDGLL